ncbi:hypothetical protein FisN_2Hh144 [Fistulifera solaris]|uniref:Uncharacterized protein n=1 Tax=Fistulifera solaris TaxID=1519565 RepID=A0A1Z5KQ18_FISSO|nr:hypothetical protein FisN_2Hh144 [Fistulifera solaris]|eukprot:GAX28038.1 hypothetical protein FisN_2Hh144 [Fistulifera solaris]
MKQRILSPSHKTHVGSPRKGYITTAYINCKERFNNMNPRHRWAFFGVWLLWKVIAGCVVLYVAYEEFLPSGLRASSSSASSEKTTKVLYIVTSLAEFNTGQRKTVKNQDRLKEVLLPVLADSIQSIVKDPQLQVDVFLITAFSLQPEREALIRRHLPPNVGLQVWDDACPLGYDPPLREATAQARLSENTRALARQHRYVIRDKMEHYDLFVAVEDDMRITGEHIQHFVETSQAIDVLREAAPLSGSSTDWKAPLSRSQLDRMVPGFVRVEVLLNPAENGPQTKLAPIPLDYEFSSSSEAHFDPSICCHVNLTDDLIPREAPIPASPSRDDIVIWETTIEAMAVRKLPNLGWVALLPGPGKKMKEADRIFGYWSGDGGAFGKDATKPSPGEPHLIAQQGGWMATRDQIHRLQDLCMGSFLPPFDPPEYRSDGQESMNVEFWSGGYQFFTGVKGGCNMQRIVSLQPEHFSKHFIYHAANNKQRQLSRERMLKADHFMAQLNSVRKAAEKVLLQSNMM